MAYLSEELSSNITELVGLMENHHVYNSGHVLLKSTCHTHRLRAKRVGAIHIAEAEGITKGPLCEGQNHALHAMGRVDSHVHAPFPLETLMALCRLARPCRQRGAWGYKFFYAST